MFRKIRHTAVAEVPLSARRSLNSYCSASELESVPNSPSPSRLPITIATIMRNAVIAPGQELKLGVDLLVLGKRFHLFRES